MLRGLQQPMVTVACAVFVLLSVSIIPNSDGNNSIIRSAIFGPGKWRHGCWPSELMGYEVIIEQGKTRIIPPWQVQEEYVDANLASAMAAGTFFASRMAFQRSIHAEGWFGLTAQMRSVRFAVYPELPPAQERLAEDALLAYLQSSDEPRARDVLDRIRDCIPATRETLVSGYVQNAVTLAVLLLGVLSAGWVRDVPSWTVRWYRLREERRRLQRLWERSCPRCGYSTIGLSEQAGARCPECGGGIALKS